MWLPARVAAALALTQLDIQDDGAYTGDAQTAWQAALCAVLKALAGSKLQAMTLRSPRGAPALLDGHLLQLHLLQRLSLAAHVGAGRDFGAPVLRGSLAQLSQLTSLRLSGWELQADLPPSLVDLVLSGPGSASAVWLKPLAHLSNLTNLELRGYSWPGKGKLQLPASLRRLAVWPRGGTDVGTDLASAAAGLLAGAATLPQLQVLQLQNWGSCAAGSLGLNVALLSPLTTLTAITLTDCNIRGDLEAALEPMQQLASLSLCTVTHADGTRVLGLPRLPMLEVRRGYMRIGSKGEGAAGCREMRSQLLHYREGGRNKLSWLWAAGAAVGICTMVACAMGISWGRG